MTQMDGQVSAATDELQPAADATRRFRFVPRPPTAQGVDARYSRFVGMMKWFLPLVALVLIATVVIWPGSIEQSGGFHLSFAALRNEDDKALTMVRPRYVGTDSNNRPFVVTADLAEQSPGDQRRIRLHTLQADMTSPDGGWFTVLADGGLFHQDRQHLRLDGPINFFSDMGYEFHAQSAEIDLAAGTARSEAPVHGQGPFGTLRADRLEVESHGRRMRFMGQVRLVVWPQARS